MHDEFDGGVRKSEIMKTSIKKLPVNIVKCFLKIKLESNIAFLPLRFPHKVSNFLQNNRVVISAPTWQKTALVGPNNIVKDRSEAMDKDFGDDFIGYVAEAEVFIGFRRVKFRDKGYERISRKSLKQVEKCLQSHLLY